MGNVITFDYKSKKDDDDIVMSNGMTDVLLDYLLLSGGRIAKTDTEKRMMMFLGEKIQSVVGSGNVGFAIAEMPWQADYL